jgi:hypothetical protein
MKNEGITPNKQPKSRKKNIVEIPSFNYKNKEKVQFLVTTGFINK